MPVPARPHPARPPRPPPPPASPPAPAGACCPSCPRPPPPTAPARSPVSSPPVSDVRAAVMHGPGRLSVERFPAPDPAPGAVVLRMLYSGICGTDKHTWRGESLQYAGTDHERPVPYPIICGHENVGVIEAIGDGPPPVDELGRPLAVGDRVVPAPNLTCGRCRFCLGEGYPYYLCTALDDYGNSLTCAEPPHLFGGWSRAHVPAAGHAPVPGARRAALAAGGADRGAGGHARARRRPRDGGAGRRLPLRRHRGRGRARAAGADAPGQGRDARRRPADRDRPARAERLEHGRGFGADAAAERLDHSPDERRARVRDVTGGLGADVVVDCSGAAGTFPEALELVRAGRHRDRGRRVRGHGAGGGQPEPPHLHAGA